MKRVCFFLAPVLCLTALLLPAVPVHAEDAARVDLKIEYVALFKNGMAYVTSSAVLPRAAVVELGQLPVPSHGTFWVGVPEDLKMRALVTRMEEVEESVPVRTVAELLQANPGRIVTIRTGGFDSPALTGILVKASAADESAQQPSPYVMDVHRPSQGRRYQPHQVSQIVLLKTGQGTIVLNAGSVTRADFGDAEVNTCVPVMRQRPNIRLELDRPARGKRVGVSYLCRGLTWAPSYMIDLSDPAQARLSAKAVVVNETADMKDVRLELVTGFPNIRFGDVNSPIAMSQKLDGFLKALRSGRSESRGNRNVMSQQAVAYNYPVYERSAQVPMPGYSTAREGTAVEDLFLYPVERFTLARGETACLPLFTAQVPYRHIYIWKIADMLDKNERYRQQRQGDEQPPAEEVWHSCRLQNNMKMPWTTAPAEFVKDGRLVGQDICYYTAPGAETTVRINRAMNVLAEAAELEVERKRNAAQFHGYRYDLVKVKGELKVRNRLDKSANLEVTKELSGEVLETLPEATDIPTAKGLKRVNPRHMLVWECELKAGERKTLSYVYEVYVRN